MYKNERNYKNDIIETAVRQVWSDMKSKSSSSESTKRIIAKVFGVYPNEVLHKLPSTDTTAQKIRYKRRKTSEHPPEPSNIGFVIPPSHLKKGLPWSIRGCQQPNPDLNIAVIF